MEEWANAVSEGTWARPDSEDKVKALVELLKAPLPVGIEGMDAIAKIESIIGDDDLNDAIFHLAQDQGPDADSTPTIKEWLQNHMPQVASELDTVLQSNGRDQQTNWVQPVSPKQAQPQDQYGATSLDEPVTESDDLSFIRTLAGLAK